jgi:outer membrane protein TolC
MEETLARTPSLKAARERLEQARARSAQAGAGYWPTLTLQGGALWQNEVLMDFGSMVDIPDTLPIDIDFQSLTVQPGFQWQGALQSTWPLLAPQVWAARKLGRQGEEAAEDLLEVERSRVAGLVVEAWHASARAHALEDEALEGQRVAESVLALADGLVRNGVASPDALLPARSALASARAGVTRVRALVEAADAALATLTGQQGVRADPVEPPAENRPAEIWIASIDRPELRAARAQVLVARAAVSVQKSGALPVLAATGTVSYLDPAPGLGEDWNWRVLLGATVPIFQGGLVRARVQEADARVAEALAAEEALREAVELDVRRAHGALSAALASLVEHEEAASLAREAVEAAMKRVREGGGSLLAVEQAQANLAMASMRRVTARCDAAVAWDRLSLAVRGR